MGGGVSSYETQGVESRGNITRMFSPPPVHFKFASVQCEMLKDSKHDPEIAHECLKSINEAMNESVETNGSQNLREELCGCGLDAIVIELLTTFINHEECQKECLISIGSLAYRSEARKVRLIELGAAVGISNTLEKHPTCEAVLEEGLWASGNLSAGSEKLKNALFQTPIVDRVILTIEAHKSNANIQKTGLIFIGNMSNGSDSRNVGLMRVGALRAALAALEKFPDALDVQAYGFFALGNLCENSTARTEAIIASGALEYLVKAMEKHRTSRVVQQYSLKLITMVIRGGTGSLEVWRKIFDDADAHRLINVAKETHSTDKYGVVSWAQSALKEYDKDLKKRVVAESLKKQASLSASAATTPTSTS